MKNKYLVLGASIKPNRYSNLCVRRFREHGFEVLAIGNKEGSIGDVEIMTGEPDLKKVHTITIYLSKYNQQGLEDYILSLEPERIIFNPGAANPDFESRCRSKGIQTINGCTLVMISLNELDSDRV